VVVDFYASQGSVGSDLSAGGADPTKALESLF